MTSNLYLPEKELLCLSDLTSVFLETNVNVIAVTNNQNNSAENNMPL
jgi:hypothetical protein